MAAVILTLLLAFTCGAKEQSAKAATSSPNFHSGSRADGSYDYLKAEGIWYIIAKAPQGNENGQLYAAGLAVDMDKVVIPASLEHDKQKYDVLGVNDWGFYEESSIKTLDVQCGYIGEYAFYNCDGISTLTLSDKLTEAGSYAFAGCDGIGSAVLPAKLKTIPQAMFESCGSLKAVTLGSGTKTVGQSAFARCEALNTVTLNKGLTKISDFAFQNCLNLKSIKFKAKLKKLGKSAFAGCSKLTSVKIPKKITEIPDNCFERCTSLKKVTLPAGIKKIGSGAFQFCPNLKSVSGKNTKLTSIGNSAFAQDEKLKSFTFGNVKSIGDSAFSSTALKKVKLGNKLTKLGNSAFSGTKLTSVRIPASLKAVPEDAFYGCASLSKVIIEAGVESIGARAFKMCKKLKDFDYPDTITYISKDSLESTEWLELAKGQFVAASYDGSTYYTYYNSDTGYDYSKVPEAICINDVCIWVDVWERYINEYGSWTEKAREEITFPANCKVLSLAIGIERQTKRIVVPEGVEYMDGFITIGYVENDAPVEVVLPSTLKELNCTLRGTQFTSVTLPDNIEKIGSGVFDEGLTVILTKNSATHATVQSFLDTYGENYLNVQYK